MTVYSYEEAFKASLEYFQGEELSAKVFIDKYSLRDENNNLLEDTPDKMHRRLAKEFARIESSKFKKPLTEDEIYDLFKNYGQVLPQGSVISAIGNPYQFITSSNCYVLTTPIDCYNSILDTDKELVNISKRRGGVGIDLSNLRPANSPTKNSARTSTGIVSWMERYSNSIREVGQAGRRGALMLTLSVHHPDIEKFVTVKNDKTKVTGANISVRLSDEFLTAVQENNEYEQRFPVDSKTPKISNQVSAKSIWDLIVKNAHAMAEPGLLFWDNIIRESPADCYPDFQTRSTNPCSELPLSENDSCRLMAINLFSCVKNPFTPESSYDFEKLDQLAYTTQRLMDDLIDLELECIDRIIEKINSDPENSTVKASEANLWFKIRDACSNGRRTGLGITALGDTLAALNIKYGSNESIQVTEKIYQTLKFGAYQSSVDMAKEIEPFLCWDKELEKDNQFLNRFKYEELSLETKGVFVGITQLSYYEEMFLNGKDLHNKIQKYGRRNIALLTTAPTGTISTQASLNINGKLYFNTSSGIEPVFKTHYVRRKKGNPGDENFRTDFVDKTGDHWQEFTVYHTGVKAWMDTTGKTEIDKTCPYFGATAEEINWKQRVKLQAAAQKHIDHAISSTINLPNNVTESEVAIIYETAWKEGLKGITVYRNGCRDGVLIDVVASPTKIIRTDAPKRPKELPCDVHHISVKGTAYFVLIGLFNGIPYEIMAGKNNCINKKVKQGVIKKIKRGLYNAIFDDGSVLEDIVSHSEAEEEAVTRLVSTSLRHGASINFLQEQLLKTKADLTSFAKAIARSLKHYIEDGKKVTGANCSECGGDLIYSEGCSKCQQCLASKCG